MRTFSAATVAPPDVVWDLVARPDAWGRWSPHVRGAWGLGAPEVRDGAMGAARLLGVLPVPARVTGKRAGRSWTWRVGLGLVEMVHRVEPRPGGGTTVSIDLIAPGALESVVALGYGPLIDVSLRRLARAAEGVVGAPAG
jgi:hypothetical protein